MYQICTSTLLSSVIDTWTNSLHPLLSGPSSANRSLSINSSGWRSDPSTSTSSDNSSRSSDPPPLTSNSSRSSPTILCLAPSRDVRMAWPGTIMEHYGIICTYSDWPYLDSQNLFKSQVLCNWTCLIGVLHVPRYHDEEKSKITQCKGVSVSLKVQSSQPLLTQLQDRMRNYTL